VSPVLLSVNVGMPKEVAWQGNTVYTGIWKQPIDGPAMVRRLNIDGDGQGDTSGHGGEQRAVMVYQIQAYQHWEDYLGRRDFDYGQFGENLTVDGMADDEVCIGDRYRIGGAEFEITQPRTTCYRVGLRMGVPDMAALLVSHHRPGFYMRVVTEGPIRAGDQIVQTRSGPGGLSVADTDALLYLPDRDVAKVSVALRIPALSPGWQQSFHEMLDAGAAAKPSGAPPMAAPAWPGFRDLRVTRVVAESASVSSIYLTAADGLDLPGTRGGQYLTLRVPGAADPAPVRSYSLSSAPAAGQYRVSVKREPHGLASGYLTSRLRAGDVVMAAAPRGEFVLDDGAGPVLLISAGIGITPVLSILHEMAATGSTRPVCWIHSARNPRERPLATEVSALIAALPDAREHLFYSAATSEEASRDHATPGRLTATQLAALDLPTEASGYVCGPASFMADVRAALTSIGMDDGRVHTELFGGLPPINPGLTARSRPDPHQPPGPAGSGPMVTFTRSGIATPFPADTRSVLDLADACDVPTRWSCRTGVCHTCITPLLSGTIAYAPEPLDPPTDGQALICCARPTSDVVLDM
jgi:ferredoxin-NADP reductase/MOSC domain-containing protein YiiM